ncbi:hypothetical protein BGZ97_003516 [Linnemannia gamsii]|uniref:Uncharacterized protein n=1 Tax=Linnemannia gamsii TaxID=64522 RepID=A0A9P6QUE3_9FUNG|nr:hypothetical protein BGZ97_003516 [Linnemannia gamsii]
MAPPSAPLPPAFPKTSIAWAPITIGNKRKTTSFEPASIPPSKESRSGADDTLFQGGRELWLAKRLTDPDIYVPLQASKGSPSPPGVRFKTKAAVHRYLASEFNQQREHAGFVVDEGKIKNKIAKISQHFKLAHRFRHASGVGETDEMTWRDVVKERCTHYFILEPVWSSVWGDGITLCADSLTYLSDNIIADGNLNGSRPTGSTQHHSDGSSEDERSDADTRSGHDQGWADVIAATEDDNAGDAAEEELDESPERVRYHTATRVTPAFGSHETTLPQADPDEGQMDGSEGSKAPTKSPRSDLLQELNALGRYEIDARKQMEIRQMDFRKEMEMRRMDLIEKTELAEIELRKAIRLAEINAVTKQEKALLEREEFCLEVEKRVLAKEKELERLLDIARKQLGAYPTPSTVQ